MVMAVTAYGTLHATCTRLVSPHPLMSRQGRANDFCALASLRETVRFFITFPVESEERVIG
jgi:hypothetical protein